MIIRPIVIAALATALVLFLVGDSSGHAQETQTQNTIDVRGQVVNGTEGAGLPDDLSVLMLITGADGRLAGTGQAKPDAEDRFVLPDVEILDGGTYTVSVDHLGVFYGTSLTADGLADDLVLTVYEITKDASIIHVERQVMVVAAVDKTEQLVSAIEFIRIVNPTDRTLLPDLTNLEQISFLRFALPPGPAELTVRSDLPGGDVVSIGTGFALTSPVIPGGHSIDFSYTFPYDNHSLSYRQSLVQGAGIFQVLVPEKFPDMAVTGLNNIDPVNIQGTSYRAYEGRDFPPGQGLQLEITGLPLPGVWARFSNSVTGGSFWQIAIPSALGATLAAMLLWGLIRGYRPEAAAEGPAMSPTVTSSKRMDPAERKVVIQAVAALDQRFQMGVGGLSEADYQVQRRQLLARVLHPGASPDVNPDDEKDGMPEVVQPE